MHPRVLFYNRHVMALAALVGLFTSMYLLYVYITGGPIVCVISGGCETVRATQWAHPFGIPTPIFGVLFYIGMMILMGMRVFAPHVHPERVRQWLFIGSGMGLVFSIFLTALEAFVIHAYCTWCVVSALSSMVLFLTALFDRRTRVTREVSLEEMGWFFGMVAAFVVIGGAAFFILIRG